MEDWNTKDNKITFKGYHDRSRIMFLTNYLGHSDPYLKIEARFGFTKLDSAGSAGFEIGVMDSLDPSVKAAAYYGKGIPAGVSVTGKLFLHKSQMDLPDQFNYDNFLLIIQGDNTQLGLKAVDKDGNEASITAKLDHAPSGYISLMANFFGQYTSHFWVDDLRLTGKKWEDKSENSFGPVL